MEYFKDWDRETSILFTSMVFGSYIWVIAEHIVLAVFAGLAAHFMLTAIYEAAARVLNLPHLSYVQDFEKTILPHIQRLMLSMPRIALRRRV